MTAVPSSPQSLDAKKRGRAALSLHAVNRVQNSSMNRMMTVIGTPSSQAITGMRFS
jgi:hypothetical protein